MDNDADTLDIPEMEYDARVTMQSAAFSLKSARRAFVFTSDGETANGSVLLRQSTSRIPLSSPRQAMARRTMTRKRQRQQLERSNCGEGKD